MIAEGLYRLTKDFKNPHPDRRCTDRWAKAPIVAAGTEFIVRFDFHGAEVDLYMAPRRQRYFGLYSVRCDDAEYSDLIAALVPVETMDWDAIEDRFDTRPVKILDRLISEGFITEKALAKIAAEQHAEEVARWRAAEATEKEERAEYRRQRAEANKNPEVQS